MKVQSGKLRYMAYDWENSPIFYKYTSYKISYDKIYQIYTNNI